MINISIINASDIKAVENVSKSLIKGAFATIFVDKEPKMNKGTKNNRNPYLGRVRECVTYSGWAVGTDYVRSCQNAVERSGSTETFIAKESWHVRYNDFFVTNKSGGKFYLQIQKSAKQGSKTERTYYVDGRIATKEDIEGIEKWLPKHNNAQSSSQVESGITEEFARDYRNIELGNISAIKQGEIYITLDKESESKVESASVAVASR